MQELIKEPGQADKITDYLGGYIYENHDLQYLLTAEGRAVRDPATETFKEEYFVKDHLGNVRSTIDITDKPLLQYLATYEIASANLEGMLFDGVSEIRSTGSKAKENAGLVVILENTRELVMVKMT